MQLSPSYQYMYRSLEVLPKDEPMFFQLLGKLVQAAAGPDVIPIAYGVPLQSPLFQTHALRVFGQLPVPAWAGAVVQTRPTKMAARPKAIFFSKFIHTPSIRFNFL